MMLPIPPRQYTPGTEGERNRLIELADRRNLKVDTDVEMTHARMILRAADGSRWAIVVSPGGVLSCVPA